MLQKLGAAALIALASFAANPLLAQPATEIEQMLRERDQQIKAILGPSGEPTGAQRERLRAVVNDVIDFKAVAQTAMGPFWDELSAERREAFAERFGAVVQSLSLVNLELYRAQVSYSGVEVEGESAVARTVATIDGARARVDYLLHRRDGRWLVTDILLDGTSTAQQYGRSFQRILQRDGLEAGYQQLMESLRRRLDGST